MTVVATPAAPGANTTCGLTPEVTPARGSPQEIAAGLPPEAHQAANAYLHFVCEAGPYAPPNVAKAAAMGDDLLLAS